MTETRKTWTLMASHGTVLFYLAANPESTMRELSEALGITERQIARIIRDLEAEDMIEITRIGRRNTYRVNEAAHFRHPTLSHVPLKSFVDMLAGYREKAPSA